MADRTPGARFALAAAIVGSTLAFLDIGATNIALPAIQRDLSTTVRGLQWVVEAYALLLAALLLPAGGLADRFGRRAVFSAGTLLFGIASVLCAMAPDATWLIAGRAVQGVGAGMMVPGSMALIAATHAPSARGAAYGIWAGASAITSSAGPVLGGWLVDIAGWRWVFWINPPLVVLTLVLVLGVRETRDREQVGRIDATGALLSVAGLGLLVFGLIEAPHHDLDAPRVWAPALAGLVLLALLWQHQRRAARPMMPRGLWRDRTFRNANILTLLLYFSLGGLMFFLPLNLVQVQGYSAGQAGLAMLPFLVPIGLLSPLAGRLADRYGDRLPLTIGPLVAGAGMLLLILPGVGDPFWSHWFPGLLVVGLGMATAVAPLTRAVMNAAPERRSGVASGINNAVSRTAGLLAVAVLGLVASMVFQAEMLERVDQIGLDAEEEERFRSQWDRLAGAGVPEGVDDEAAQAARDAVQAAFVAGFRWVAGVAAALAMLGAWAGSRAVPAQAQRR